jgi:di/tricarboxylate transporter
MEALGAPNAHAVAVMALTVLAFFLFSRESVSIESSSVLVLTLLTLGFVLFPFETKQGRIEPDVFFLGFGNESLVAICALMMASEGLVKTGALTPIGRSAARVWQSSPSAAMLGILVVTTVVSAFMNNTPQVVVMIPILISVALRSGTSPSRLLMPMTFSAQIGGVLTPIGTGLNLLVIGSAAGLGVHRFGMFDFIAPGAIVAAVGVLYLWLVAPRLLPDRETHLSDTSPRVFNAVLHVCDESKANGKSVAEVMELTAGKMSIDRIRRGENLTLAKLPVSVLRAGDRIHVSDHPENLKEFEEVLGVALYDGKGESPVTEEHPLKADEQQLAEIVVTEGSPLARRTLAQAGFEYRYELVPLALHRRGREGVSGKELRDEALHVGDVLLVQGAAPEIARVKEGGELLVLDATTDLPHTAKAPIAIAIMALVVALAALRVLPISVSALSGVVLMAVTGCLKWRDATRALDAGMIFLTVASLALSTALVQTGGAQFLAQAFVAGSYHLAPVWVLSGVVLVMALFANVISNTAAAVIGTPVAVSVARLLGAPPEPFVLAVLFGANMGYATPMADNCNLLVFSAGGYHFRDFIKVGLPLALLLWATVSLVLPRFYPLG